MGIESVVDKENAKLSNGVGDAACSACEMAVVWIQSQLRQNMTQERILNYVNEVTNKLSFQDFCETVVIVVLITDYKSLLWVFLTAM